MFSWLSASRFLSVSNIYNLNHLVCQHLADSGCLCPHCWTLQILPGSSPITEPMSSINSFLASSVWPRPSLLSGWTTWFCFLSSFSLCLHSSLANLPCSRADSPLPMSTAGIHENVSFEFFKSAGKNEDNKRSCLHYIVIMIQSLILMEKRISHGKKCCYMEAIPFQMLSAVSPWDLFLEMVPRIKYEESKQENRITTCL